MRLCPRGVRCLSNGDWKKSCVKEVYTPEQVITDEKQIGIVANSWAYFLDGPT